MIEILQAVAGWETLLVAVLVLGVLPGAALRVIVRAFPKEDPRRRELQAELYVVPWWERPFWVAQQLEVAVFEGLGGRIRTASSAIARRAIAATFRSWAIRRDLLQTIDSVAPQKRLRWALRECMSASSQRWHLVSGVEMNRLHPSTFWVPDENQKSEVGVGDVVKLMFETSDGWGERMWVKVTRRGRRGFVGALANDPIGIPRLGYGDRVCFSADEVIDIDPEPESACAA